eukprot:349929-Chlamydomonas_euryale.AAC.12
MGQAGEAKRGGGRAWISSHMHGVAGARQSKMASLARPSICDVRVHTRWLLLKDAKAGGGCDQKDAWFA